MAGCVSGNFSWDMDEKAFIVILIVYIMTSYEQDTEATVEGNGLQRRNHRQNQRLL